ncbi:hypothetical protein, partial [Marinomonas aquimarina]|uniref:hypothetical protein n=1 Tax=Marinomonas aquimarina TaxID=295068 RepID=UPI001E43B51C
MFDESRDTLNGTVPSDWKLVYVQGSDPFAITLSIFARRKKALTALAIRASLIRSLTTTYSH